MFFDNRQFVLWWKQRICSVNTNNPKCSFVILLIKLTAAASLLTTFPSYVYIGLVHCLSYRKWSNCYVLISYRSIFNHCNWSSLGVHCTHVNSCLSLCNQVSKMLVLLAHALRDFEKLKSGDNAVQNSCNNNDGRE